MASMGSPSVEPSDDWADSEVVGAEDSSLVLVGAGLLALVLGGTGGTGVLDESAEEVTGALDSALEDVTGEAIEADVVARADAAAGSMPGLPATVVAHPAITVTAASALASRHARAFMLAPPRTRMTCPGRGPVSARQTWTARRNATGSRGDSRAFG
jgi:hypothetical protein